MAKYNIPEVAKEVLAYFNTKDALQEYWKTHSRREIDLFVQKTFKVSYFIFRRVVLEVFELKDRTQDDCIKLNKLHRQQTNLERYGRINVGQFGTAEHKAAMIAKYGVDNYFKTAESAQLTSDRCKGVPLADATKRKLSETVRSAECQYRTKQTNLEKYGVEYTFQVDEFRVKSKKTLLKKYGVAFPPSRRYSYKNLSFDSLPELALFLYAEANNENITRLPIEFSYIVAGKTYRYYPDFEYQGRLIELKGNQFLAADGTWHNPYDHSFDSRMQAKRQCALQHGVEIWYPEDYKFYLDWFLQKGYKKENYLVKEA